jgi:hypothetical protein
MKSREHKNARDRARRKLKKSKNKYVIRKSSGDLVAIQIAIRVSAEVKNQMRRKNGLKLTRELLESMIRHKAETSTGEWTGGEGGHCSGCMQGDDPTGIELKIIRWRNPDRLASEDQGWRYANPDSPSEQDEAWGTLRRIIQTAPLGIRFDR